MFFPKTRVPDIAVIYIESYLYNLVFPYRFRDWRSMVIINTKIDESILTQFRDTIYHRTGLKRGDFKKSLEVVMIDYIINYSKSENGKKFALKAKEAIEN